MDLAEFLLARIAEDESGARAAAEYTDRDWDSTVVADSRYGWRVFINGDGDPVGELNVQHGVDPRPIVEHIARHDPGRVLAECAAKRAIVEMHRGNHECPCGWVVDEPCETTLLLAQPYADHPDYRPEWGPTE